MPIYRIKRSRIRKRFLAEEVKKMNILLQQVELSQLAEIIKHTFLLLMELFVFQQEQAHLLKLTI
jgi:hypothetical protein